LFDQPGAVYNVSQELDAQLVIGEVKLEESRLLAVFVNAMEFFLVILKELGQRESLKVNRFYIVRKWGREQIAHVDARDHILAMGTISDFSVDVHVENRDKNRIGLQTKRSRWGKG
jgi:hypothetical protein